MTLPIAEILASGGALQVRIPTMSITLLVDQVVFDSPIQPQVGRPVRGRVISMHGLNQSVAAYIPGDLLRAFGIGNQYRGRMPMKGTFDVRWRATCKGFEPAWLP